jgi:hypothetical protein
MCVSQPTPPAWPLFSETARLSWLRSCCAVAESADEPLACAAAPDAPQQWTATACVSAVLGDDRVSMLGGREGLPRSLASVFGGA